MARVRVRSEVGKGIEALREATINFTDTLAGSATYYGIAGPWETDVEIMDVVVTPGTITTGSANTLDVFNGTAATNHVVITQFDPDTIANQVPTSQTLIGYTRVTAGTPVTVKFVSASSGASTPNTLSVKIRYDVPYWDYSAKTTTYGAYDDSL